MSSRLPIFPLPAVLFPGTPLPLHIFEPRYKRMLQTFDDDPDTQPASDEATTDAPLSLSFQVAGAIECDPGVKHRPLAERSTARRFKTLLFP